MRMHDLEYEIFGASGADLFCPAEYLDSLDQLQGVARGDVVLIKVVVQEIFVKDEVARPPSPEVVSLFVEGAAHNRSGADREAGLTCPRRRHRVASCV